jgi:hypothetical protein
MIRGVEPRLHNLEGPSIMTEQASQKATQHLSPKLFQYFGGVLLFGLVAWIIFSIATQPLSALRPEIPGLSRGLEAPGPAEKEMEGAVEHAKQVMYGKYRTAHVYQWLSRISDWIGFGLTSMITVLAGALGHSLRPGEDPADTVKTLAGTAAKSPAPRLVTAVGIGAALASVLIGLSSKLQTESQRAMDQGEKVRTLVAAARKDFIAAANTAAAIEVANNLDAETRKNE